MKQILFILFTLLPISAMGQEAKDFAHMSKKEKEVYMVNIAKEVTQNFGPGWYRKTVIPSISEINVCDESQMPKNPQLDLKKNIGRKYYIVTLNYDEKTRKKYIWSYASKVRVWADDGEPFMITFGNNYGMHFFEKTYRQYLNSGLEGVEKNYFDALTWEEFEKQIQPMYETIRQSHENTK